MAYSKLVPSITERPSSPETGERNPQNKKRRATFRSFKWICSIIFSSLWLAPAIYILFINFRGQINPRAGVIGQSIGCLGNSQKCKLDLQSVNQITQAQKLAKLDRNALGALQLAAKALEVWFLAIAASLIFIMLKMIARRNSRVPLPIRFIYVHATLGELLSLGGLLLWKPLKKPLKKLLKHIRGRHLLEHWAVARSDGNRVSKLSLSTASLYAFSIFAILVSIVCSVMGPATAVLVLPAMQWTKINTNSGSSPIWLDTIKAGQPPQDLPIFNCTSDNFTAGHFSCMGNFYSAFVDSIAAGAVATDKHAFLARGNSSKIGNTLVALPLFQEANVTFSANISGSNPVIWVPLRQTLRGFDEDIENYDLATSTNASPQPGYPDSNLFQKSLQARIQRGGPTIGMQSNCRLSGPAEQTNITITIGKDQMVRCYKGIDDTRCIPSGNGWSGIDQASSYFGVLDAQTLGTDAPENINVTVYSASVSLTMPSSQFPCVGSGTCGWNWATAFSDQTSPLNANVTGPLQATEYTSPNLKPDSSVWCDATYAQSTASYVLDPSQVTNLFRRVDLNADGFTGTLAAEQPLYVDPDWVLAGWAVDRNGSVNAFRNVAARLIVAWQNWVVDGDGVQSFADFNNMHRFIAIHTLSLIPFTTTTNQPTKQADRDKQLSNYAQVQAWKYDLSTHTSKLGAIVMVAGCLLVLLRTVLYCYHGDDVMDTTDILKSIIQRYCVIGDEQLRGTDGTYPILTRDEVTGDVGFRA
jgi:hypothetical protein